MRRSLGVLLICFLAMVVIDAKPVHAANLLVSAYGDLDSIGNSGVGAEIRTHSYSVPSSYETHAFWVGDELEGGGFVQFGYLLQTGNFMCVNGVTVKGQQTCLSNDSITNGDARWFWEYWPDSKVITFYYGIGTANSAGPEGAWHTYQILPSAAGGWSFLLDGKEVASMNRFHSAKSKYPAYVAAEEVAIYTSSINQPASGSLGPVEFRNVAYYNQDWHQVRYLKTDALCVYVSYTGMSKCSVNIPYGVTVLGPNDVVIGRDQPLRKDGELVWGNQLSITMPSGVQVAVDGVSYNSPQLTYTSPGSHSLSVPSTVPKDNSTRLRFDHWSDGSTLTNRTTNVQGDTKLTAIYQTQYRLSLIGFPAQFTATGEEWYDSGSTAKLPFSAPSRFLLWTCQGWYENGDLVADANNGSIRMDAPHTLTARLAPDYPLIGIILCIIALVVISMLYYRSRTGTSGEVKPEPQDQETVTADIKRTRSSKKTEIFCNQCGATIPRNSKFCKECGSKLIG